MREILFRGKRVDDGEWIEGDLLKNDEKAYIVCDTYEIDAVGFEKDTDLYIEEWHEVKKETVCQYTGLTDKNGKKIFEGDYVVCNQYIGGNQIDYHCEIGYVEMKHGAFGLHREQGYYRPFKDWLEDYEYEVIGNIFDNPDLLTTSYTDSD